MARCLVAVAALVIVLGVSGCMSRDRGIEGTGDPSADAGTGDASADGAPTPPPPPPTMSDAGPTCTPACIGRECGADGCGGTCGSCSDGDLCSVGECTSSCPPRSSPTGDGACACDAGYTISADCRACVTDVDGDGCPPNAAPGSGTCVCDSGYHTEGCACVEDAAPPPPPPPPACPTGESEWCGGCIADPDGDGCPAHASLVAGTCACDSGYAFDATGCTCEVSAPDFTHPAFEASGCAGPRMPYATAEMRHSDGSRNLGPYQLVFRNRTCSASDVCGPWAEVPLTSIAWATRASGILNLVRIDGVVKVDMQYGICDDPRYSPGSRTYIEGGRCSGVGATLICTTYGTPGECDSGGVTAYRELEGERLRFSGELNTSCARLVADVRRTTGSGYVEAQAGLLVRF